MSRKVTTEIFIKDANKIHNFIFKYSKFIYINAITKGIIICKEHGEFSQSPNSHLRGKGCPKCSGKNKTTEEVIKEFKKIHNNTFIYSIFKYKNAKTKITIICRIHGSFKQSVQKHLSGHGCPKCSKTFKSNLKNFIKKSKLIHGNNYKYIKSIYKNWETPLIIICRKHGDFKQTPMCHLAGSGCPRCKNSKGESLIEVYLKSKKIKYITQKTFPNLVGIGSGRLKFDFYIPTHNLLIEFDGQQHYEHNTWIKNYKFTKLEFKKTQLHDEIKNKYAKNNNIDLLRIPHWNLKNIPQILEKEFK